jgi:hypothetical protein
MSTKQLMDAVSRPVWKTKRISGLTHEIRLRLAVTIMSASIPPIPVPAVVVMAIRVRMIVPEISDHRRWVVIGITTIKGTSGKGQENQQKGCRPKKMSFYHGIAPFSCLLN